MYSPALAPNYDIHAKTESIRFENTNGISLDVIATNSDQDHPAFLTVRNTGGPTGFIVQRADGVGNFVKGTAGLGASGFFFHKNTFWAATPGDDLLDVYPDWNNTLIVYGGSHATHPGEVGIGTNSPTEKLHVNGNIRESSFITTSDKGLKDNVSLFQYGLNEILELNPIFFTYNGKGGTVKGSSHIGLYAQELQDVVPELVKEFEHIKYENSSIDEESVIKSRETFLAIKDNEIKYLIINAVKEQQAIIDRQEDLIESLMTRIDRLEKTQGFENGNYKLELNNEPSFRLFQNSPNPGTTITSIPYQINQVFNSAEIRLFDLSGQLLSNKKISNAGRGVWKLDLNAYSAGGYMYSLIVDGQLVATKKMFVTN